MGEADLTATSSRPTSSRAAGEADARAPCAEHQDVLVDDVRDERARVAVRTQAAAGLVPDQVAFRDEADRRRPRGQVRAGEEVSPVLVGVAHDDDRVAILAQDAEQLPEDAPPSGRGRPGSPPRWPGRAGESVTIA